MKSYGYLIIRKADGFCFQGIKSPIENFSVNNEEDYSIPVSVENINKYVGKYFLNGVWFWREYTELDKDGNPVEGSPHIDHIWNPEEGES